MEIERLKNKLEITKKNLELAKVEIEGKDKIITQMNKTIENLKWQVDFQYSMNSQIKDIADKLLEKVDNSQASMLGKKDIMEIFGKESDFALRFLRAAKSMKFGTQIGKEYYITRKEFEKMLTIFQGQKLEI